MPLKHAPIMLEEMAQHGVLEHFESGLRKVKEDIDDPSKKPDAKRSFDLRFIFEPDAEGYSAKAAQLILKTLDTGVRIEAARTARDDGISPEFKRSKGATGADWNDAIKGHLELQPRRTFPEVEQPVTLCSLRAEVRDDEDHPVRVKLVEADGGAWIPAATEAIAKWLKGKTGAAPILS